MDGSLILVFVAMGLVTYACRAASIVLLPGRKMPTVLREWLEFVPVAVLAGLVAPSILAPGGSLRLALANPWLLAAIPTIGVAVWRRSLWRTIVVGVLAFALLLHLGFVA